MANVVETICVNGHPVEQRYRKPNGALKCHACERQRTERYRLAHPDRIITSSIKYYASHREACLVRTRRWAYAHRETKARMAANLRSLVLEKLGNVCVRCGFKDKRALQIDHVNGGGSQELNKGTRKMHLKILANDAGYQLLCANCNAIKKVENHEVPQPRFSGGVS